MATAKKRLLSASVDGQGILVDATTLSGSLLHTGIAGTTPGTYDEVWLWATNNSNTGQQLAIQFGTTGVLNNLILNNLAVKSGLVPIVPGFPVQNGLRVSACASSGSCIAVMGFVNNITD